MPTPTVFSTDGYDVHPDFARQHLTLLKQQAFRALEAYREAHQIWTAPEHDRFGRYMGRDRQGNLIIPRLRPEVRSPVSLP
jgi:dsDNA-binding SOS-regulon protein